MRPYLQRLPRRGPLRGRWVHLCFLDRQCRALGCPPRIYVHVLGFWVGWDEDRDVIPPG